MGFSTLSRSHSQLAQPQITEKSIEAETAIELRYPKRKRGPINYAEADVDEFVQDEEEDYEPNPKKAKTRKSSRPLPKQKIFPFLSLPAELRNKIYDLALSTENGVFITSKTKGHRRLAQRCIESECKPQFERSHRRYYNYHMNHNNSGSNDEEDPTQSEPAAFSPNLLCVSKTVYSEAASFLYGQRIVVADNYALLSFLNQIGRRHMEMLHSITIKEWCGGRSHRSINFPAMTLLASAMHLERLIIDCSIGYFSSYAWRGGKSQELANRVARKVFRDCYPLLEAKVRSKGRIDAGVDLVTLADRNFIGGGWRQSGVEPGEDERRMMDENTEMYRAELQRLLRT